jgi:hypothetical protein
LLSNRKDVAIKQIRCRRVVEGVPDLGACRFPVCVAEAVRVIEPVLAADLVYGSAAEWCWRRWRPIGERREASDRWVRGGRREEAGG